MKIQVRYNKLTNQVTGWSGDERQFNLVARSADEALEIIDSQLPQVGIEYCKFRSGDSNITQETPPPVEPTLEERLKALEDRINRP